MKSSQIGVQLYTLRDETARDMVGTLRRVAEIGYGAVEFAGYGNAAPREIRDTLDGEGMTAIGAHVAFVDLETRPLQVLADSALLGCEAVVVPSVPDTWTRTPSDVGRLAERLNSLGELCLAEGLRLAYHNHADEFRPLGASTAWELLAAETGPEAVELELDLYWAAYAGADPVALIRDHGDRIGLLHVKDLAADDRGSDAPVGEGRLDWQGILAAAEGSAVRWYIVEQDEPDGAFESIERSLSNIRRLAGLPAA